MIIKRIVTGSSKPHLVGKKFLLDSTLGSIMYIIKQRKCIEFQTIDYYSILGKNVHLSFLTFEMEDEQDCGYDFIEIFSGFDDTGPSYGRFCGNKIPPEIISVDDALLLR